MLKRPARPGSDRTGQGRRCPTCNRRLVNALPCPEPRCRLARKKAKAAERWKRYAERKAKVCRFCREPVLPGRVVCERHQFRKKPCPICNAPIPHTGTRGWPRRWCSQTCRWRGWWRAQREKAEQAKAQAAPVSMPALTGDPNRDLEAYLAAKQGGVTLNLAAPDDP